MSCYKLKKNNCKPPSCEWTNGKGCSRPPYMSPGKKHEYAFMGFRDDILKTQFEDLSGSKVTYGLKSSSTYVIYKKDKRIMDTIKGLAIPKMSLSDFLMKYNLTSSRITQKTRQPKAESAYSSKFTLNGEPQNIAKQTVIDWMSLEQSEIEYDGIDIGKIYRHAKVVAMKMFKKENDIRDCVKNVFAYVPKDDLFIICLRARVDTARKDQTINTVYGVTFSYNPTIKYKIRINKEVIVLLDAHEAEPTAELTTNSREAISNDYEDATVVFLPTK